MSNGALALGRNQDQRQIIGRAMLEAPLDDSVGGLFESMPGKNVRDLIVLADAAHAVGHQQKDVAWLDQPSQRSSFSSASTPTARVITLRRGWFSASSSSSRPGIDQRLNIAVVACQLGKPAAAKPIKP